MKIWRKLALLMIVSGCATPGPTPYDSVDQMVREAYKKVALPFRPGTEFKISQGAFGQNSHNEPGNEYSWDFDVQLGTPVVAVQRGKVIGVWEPGKGGGCDPKFSSAAHNVKIEHRDHTVAQYVHINSRVKVGHIVEAGQVIGLTAQNGWMCTPQLHFGIYASHAELYDSPKRKTIPLLFDGLPDGLARSGLRGRVPARPFYRQAWFADFAELKKFMAIGYANFDWMIETKRVDPAQFEKQAKASLQDARSDAEALVALKNFVAAFDDPHLRLESHKESKSNSGPLVLHSKMTGDEACSALGFKSEANEFIFPTENESGFNIANSSAESFHYGTFKAGAQKIGIIRIASFLETHYPVLCARSWEKFRNTAPATCDSKCQERFIIEHVENGLLAEFHDVLKSLERRKIEGLLVDVTGNGGGTDWEAGIARMITPKKLMCGSRGFIKHDHHAKRLLDYKIEVLEELKSSKPKDRAALASKVKEIENDLVSIGENCDRSNIWSDPPVLL